MSRIFFNRQPYINTDPRFVTTTEACEMLGIVNPNPTCRCNSLRKLASVIGVKPAFPGASGGRPALWLRSDIEALQRIRRPRDPVNKAALEAARREAGQ